MVEPRLKLARLVAGRRSKFVAIGAWILLVVGLAPFGGKFEGAQKNEPSSFLPGDAESVEVLKAAQTFPSGDATIATIVFYDPSGLNGAERQAIETMLDALGSGAVPGAAGATPPRYSRDGNSAVAAIPIVAEGDADVLVDAVDAIRSQLEASLPPPVETKVTGPAGFSADATAAFEGINSTLLFATVALVFVLLVLIYRSPIFWLLPLFAVLLAEGVVRGLGYGLTQAGVVINGQTGGILLVLVFGAGTDYALLLTARYREELLRREDKHEAMQIALVRAGPAMLASAGTVVAALLCLTLHRAAPAIFASAGTVIVGMLCLMLAEMNSTAGLGPVGALGVAVAAAAMLTLLPGLLLVGGRRAFWPYVPRVGSGARSRRRRGVWQRLGTWIERRCRTVWIVAALGLGALALGLLTLDDNLTTANSFRGSAESALGQKLIAQSFPAGASAPTVVLVPERDNLPSALAAARSAEGVSTVGRPELGDTGARFQVTLTSDPFGEEAFRLIPGLRDELRAAAGQSVLVGGPTAEETDLRKAIERDTKLLVPLVLLVVFTILILLLRSLIAPWCSSRASYCRFWPRSAGPCSSSSSSPTFRGKIRAIRSSLSFSSSRSASTTTSSSWHECTRRRSSFPRARTCSRASRSPEA